METPRQVQLQHGGVDSIYADPVDTVEADFENVVIQAWADHPTR